MSEIERAIEKKEYIERGAALELFWEYSGNWNLINAIPDADVEPIVRGEWKDGKCTNCGCYGFPTFDGDNERTTFCPHCGAHMMERSGSGE